ncbi:MAG: glycosyltransferase family 9 protein [Acetobacteraceae bacterium]
MRILFISANRIGDAVITTGLLDYLIRTHPDARITIACGRVAEGIFARMPNLERTILIDKRPYHLHWLPLWREAVGTLWDLVVDVRGSALAFLVPTRRRAVMRRLPGRKIEQLAALLGLDVPPMPVVWTAPADRARAAGLLPADRPVIGLGPTANWPSKVWPAERFAALFQALVAGPIPGAVPAIFGGPGERESAMAACLLELLPGAIDLSGMLSLPEAASCIQRCVLYVGNDSGLMHLAAAAGTPTIGLCGATIDRADEMAPAGRLAAWALARGPRMADLSVEDAFAAASRMFARSNLALPERVQE